MQRQPLALVAMLTMLAACTPQPGPPSAEEYVPHGRVAPAMPLAQALRECRRALEGAGRQTTPTTGPGPVRQIPEPPPARPAYSTIEACMDAKGYRRAAPRR